ncbi:hypothetical protein H8N03_18955 [Ramlibacter sp. USB13]|uniref:Uncharacterized protein n=1 Tax=Ramlibacter cellulosilyticus TaxID=2764187 RepID=A0A923MTM3_9BURK|nr:hypothetical protein [Ramlibacter cellulosilyticus]MBC5785033.1 hypothetical protein [Ramlibacter cellulosilyticus]
MKDMLCRKCGIIPDRIHAKWWQKWIPTAARYYCAGCGRRFVRLFGT